MDTNKPEYQIEPIIDLLKRTSKIDESKPDLTIQEKFQLIIKVLKDNNLQIY